MNGKGLIISVLSVGVALGILMSTLGAMILNGQESLRRDVSSLQEDVGDLRERMARLEGLFEGHISKGDN